MADGTFHKVELIGFKSIGTYVQNKRNWNQVLYHFLFHYLVHVINDVSDIIQNFACKI